MKADGIVVVEGREYSKGEIEQAFGVRFGYRISGIVVRKTESCSDRRLILLFQRSDGPYPDLLTNDRTRYIGAGLRGDQSLRGVNRVLADRGSVDGVYFFHQTSGSVKWKFLGRGVARYTGVECLGGRSVLTFDVQLESR